MTTSERVNATTMGDHMAAQDWAALAADLRSTLKPSAEPIAITFAAEPNPDVPAFAEPMAPQTDDGRTVTRKIENKKYLEGVKVGDKIDLTYTESILVDVVKAGS